MVPEGVQEACAEWVSTAYYQTLRDPLVKRQAVPGALTQTFNQEQVHIGQPPQNVALLLAPYVRRTVATNQGSVQIDGVMRVLTTKGGRAVVFLDINGSGKWDQFKADYTTIWMSVGNSLPN